MKKVDVISNGKGYTAIDLGSLNDLFDYSVFRPKLGMEIEGKVFLKEVTGASGTEISFNMVPPQTEVPYFHLHFSNEETYIILKGCGEFQVDDECFPIKEGSVIRVATKSSRGLRNSSSEPMIYLAVQSKEHTLERYSGDDAELTAFNPKWK